MKAIAALVMCGCLVAAGFAAWRLYIDYSMPAPNTTADQKDPEPESSQPGPVDPNRLVQTIPPLKPGPAPSTTAPASVPGSSASAAPEDAPESVFPLDSAPQEPRFIDSGDLDAPAEVLERRIATKARAILEKIPPISPGPVIATQSEEPVQGRSNVR